MAHNFFLATEVIGIAFVVTSEVVACAAVAQENGVLGTYGLTLSLHAEVRVDGVDHPDSCVS